MWVRVRMTLENFVDGPRWKSSQAIALVTIAMLSVLAEETIAAPFHVNGLRVQKSVVSFAERRNSRLVRQAWDISCGAAALSTVLSHYHGRSISEVSIVVTILRNTDPNRVRRRGGFSLLDLKRFAEAVGFTAKGYAGLTIDDLIAFGVPTIISVRIRGYDHFVVFKGRVGDTVLLGDPAFGNINLPVHDFLTMWPNGIGFIVSEDDLQPGDREPLAPDTMGLSVPNLNALSRFTKHGSVFSRTRLRPVLSR
jgi:predicted double-glycine peptidase